MKLYYFNPNNYSLEFFTVAESEEKAIEALNDFLQKTKYPRGKDGQPLKWGDEYFTKKTPVSPGYSIEVYEPGQVIISEIS
jgi:hypothetical protein